MKIKNYLLELNNKSSDVSTYQAHRYSHPSVPRQQNGGLLHHQWKASEDNQDLILCCSILPNYICQSVSHSIFHQITISSLSSPSFKIYLSIYSLDSPSIPSIYLSLQFLSCFIHPTDLSISLFHPSIYLFSHKNPFILFIHPSYSNLLTHQSIYPSILSHPSHSIPPIYSFYFIH